MSLINVTGLTFSYDGGYKNVFDNASFSLDTDWRLGLVGRNGRGKTTFLKLLAGEYEYSGKISASVRFTYFPYAVADASRTVCEVLRDVCVAEEWELLREFSYLSIDHAALYAPFCALSSGEQTKALLAGLFVDDGRFLLIDEPTNHLDAAARAVVAEYLKRKHGFILVSHDRAFLDGCVDHIMSINKTNIEVCAGTFSSWLADFERRQAFEQAQNAQLKKDIARLSAAASRTSAWADKTEASKYGKASSGLKQDKGYVGHKAAKVMRRAKAAEDRAQTAIERKSGLMKNVETSEKLKLDALDYRAERLVSVSAAEIIYDGKIVSPPVSFELLRGERVALCGGNGSGKSSVLKLILGADIAHTGAVSVASGLIISYVPQTSDGLRGTLGEFAAERGIDRSLFTAILNKTGFGNADYDGDIAAFSQGQKKKVLIAKSLCERAHLYVWDEPLNYIDIYSRLQIERLLQEFKPTMIFVEHDRAFTEKIATKLVRLGE